MKYYYLLVLGLILSACDQSVAVKANALLCATPAGTLKVSKGEAPFKIFNKNQLVWVKDKGGAEFYIHSSQCLLINLPN